MFDIAGILGELVAKKRQSLGVTQEQLADNTGINLRTIQQIEATEGNPTFANLYAVIQYLKIDPMAIFYPDYNTDSPSKRELEFALANCSESEAKTLLSICNTVIEALREKERNLVGASQ